MKVKIKIPETLADISLAQYQAFLERSEGKEDHELEEVMIECLCGYDKDVVRMFERKDVQDVAQHLNSLFTGSYSFIQRFKIKDVEFGFIPNLDKITQGEFIDLDTYYSDWSNAHKTMAVLFRPITTQVGEQYQVIEYTGTEEFSELMQFMPLDVALGAFVFFYNLGNDLASSTLESLTEQAVEMATASNHNLMPSGDGITASIHSQVETLQSLTKQSVSMYTKHLPF